MTQMTLMGPENFVAIVVAAFIELVTTNYTNGTNGIRSGLTTANDRSWANLQFRDLYFGEITRFQPIQGSLY